MEISVINSVRPKTGVLIVPLFQEASLSANAPKILESFLKKREKQKDFLGREGETLLVIPDDETLPGKVVLFGLGEMKKFTPQKLRELAALIVKSVRPLKKGEMTLWCSTKIIDHGQELGEGLAFGNYTLAKFKTGKEKEDLGHQNIKKVFLVVRKKNSRFDSAVKKGVTIAEAVGEVRDLVNAGPSLKNVEYITKKARKIADKNGYSIKVIGKTELEKMGMFGILGVNRGSEFGAKLVIMEYSPRGMSNKSPVAFVGKGIIFDSGGYNLKPGHSMADMQLDMAGAGTVIGLFLLLKKLGIKQKVIGIFPLTDNLIGPSAQKPSDIVTTYSGKTVEIVNTDAEGRMVLCDALSYAVEKFSPRYVIDVATLTGACMVALGSRYAGLFGNDAALIEKLREAGESTDEFAWPMPIHPDHRAKMKSKIADLRNWDEVSTAGASKGAAFLEEFVGNAKWAHLDIAGPAFVKDPKQYESPMGTGFGVRLFVEFLEKLR